MEMMRVAAIAILTFVALAFVSLPTALAQDVRAGVEQLAAQVEKRAPTGKQLRIAVADFPDLQGVTSELGRFIASRLTTRLAESQKFFVIERQRLGQVLAELKFSMTDLVEPSKAKKLGQMAGVEAIVVGSIADLGSQLDIDARVIDVETTRMLLGTSITIAKDPTVIAMLERGRVEATPASSGPSAGVGTFQPDSGATRGSAVEGLVFQQRGCRRPKENNAYVYCTVTFVNSSAEDREVKVWGQNGGTFRSRMADNRGVEYATSVLFNQSCCYGEAVVRLPPQLPVGVQFGAQIGEEVTHVTVVIGIQGFKRVVVVRDIPLAKLKSWLAEREHGNGGELRCCTPTLVGVMGFIL